MSRACRAVRRCHGAVASVPGYSRGARLYRRFRYRLCDRVRRHLALFLPDVGEHLVPVRQEPRRVPPAMCDATGVRLEGRALAEVVTAVDDRLSIYHHAFLMHNGAVLL